MEDLHAAGSPEMARVALELLRFTLANDLYDARIAAALGDGGYGARFWVDDGVNIQTKPVRLTFDQQQPEIWLRWYQRYQPGFRWSGGGGPHYDKTFYIWITPDTKGNSTLQILPQFYSSGYRIYIQSGGANDQLENNSISWTDTCSSNSSCVGCSCWKLSNDWLSYNDGHTAKSNNGKHC